VKCVSCHFEIAQLYALIFATGHFCSRHCLRAWLAAHPDKDDMEGAPE